MLSKSPSAASAKKRPRHPAGGKILLIRQRLGESQGQFAKRFGVHQTTVLDWEYDGVPKRGTTAAYVESILATLPKSATSDSPAEPLSASAKNQENIA